MQLALIGVGLIGGSAAWAMKKAGIFDCVSACDLRIENVQKAADLGIVDKVAANIEEALKEADAVMLAVPVLAMDAVFAEVGKYVKDSAFITDVGSCRQSVIAAAKRSLGEKFKNYAPVHPIAGGEMPGIEYAQSDLFVGAKAISTPEFGMNVEAVQFWEKAWKAAGSNVLRMTPAEHDTVFAEVSHVPHILSFVMVDSLLYGDDFDRRLSFAGAGFRDFTRIAASSSRMWSDICIANKEAILTSLKGFEADLAQVTRAIEKGDIAALERVFEKASAVRRKLFVRKPLH
ncbi:MAG: prephenate dehydrogenase/arogenate dehydrogenase family protein [Sutterellaceae bacterium]|nr:prephenate dehydrogenase/arogenate dehydrogenase family protein [Sutterellaceae bacterium]